VARCKIAICSLKPDTTLVTVIRSEDEMGGFIARIGDGWESNPDSSVVQPLFTIPTELPLLLPCFQYVF
jgi:hypothetical protein